MERTGGGEKTSGEIVLKNQRIRHAGHTSLFSWGVDNKALKVSKAGERAFVSWVQDNGFGALLATCPCSWCARLLGL